MASLVLFHSVLGLRPVERACAETLRAAGHCVRTPDLYGGMVADTIARGMALMNRVGWDRICEWATTALEDMPESTVLAGFSMGCGVVAAVWPSRPRTRGILLLHGMAEIPEAARGRGLPLQLHLGGQDDFWLPEEIAAWTAEAERAGLRAETFVYPGAGHFFTDRSLADYDAAAAKHARTRILRFLDEL